MTATIWVAIGFLVGTIACYALAKKKDQRAGLPVGFGIGFLATVVFFHIF